MHVYSIVDRCISIKLKFTKTKVHVYGRVNNFCMNILYGVLIIAIYTYEILQTCLKHPTLHGDCKYIFPAHFDINIYPKVQVIGVCYLHVIFLKINSTESLKLVLYSQFLTSTVAS